jgi:hypothetical protein
VIVPPVAAYVTAAGCCVPLLSSAVAVNCCVALVANVTDAGVNTICVTTGGGGGKALTASEAFALFPSDVATIVAVPGATPVARPAASTVANARGFECQATVRPTSTLPAESRNVAVN